MTLTAFIDWPIVLFLATREMSASPKSGAVQKLLDCCQDARELKH